MHITMELSLYIYIPVLSDTWSIEAMWMPPFPPILHPSRLSDIREPLNYVCMGQIETNN